MRSCVLRSVLLGCLLVAPACSRGGADSPPDAPDGAAPGADLSPAEPDLSTPPVPVTGCTWRERFQQRYGRAFNRGDVAFVTADGRSARGVDQLDLNAQKNQVPDIVKVLGSSSPVKRIDLLAPDGQLVTSRADKYIYGLGYAMWLDVNGYGEAGITEATLIRLLSMEEASYPQLVSLFRVLTQRAEAQVPAADLADYRAAAAQLIRALEGGQLRFTLGTGHGADFNQTAQTVNGKRFSFQLSNGFGLDPQLGLQRDGAWGPKWQSYSPGGGWSGSAPGMQPKCGGCTVDAFAGARYQFCDGPADWPSAEAACRARGGHLATVNDPFTNAFLRGLAQNAGDSWIGLSDQQTRDQYQWAAGGAASYFNWGPGQPDHHMDQERCVQLWDSATSTQWNDLNCAQARSYFCQVP